MNTFKALQKIAIPFVAFLAVLAYSASSASAETLAPWWGVSAGARPTNLKSGVASDEVQDLMVSATKGDVFIADLARFEATGATEGFAVLPYNATATQVQEAIETRIYPSKKVVVTGGPGDEEGTKPYVITFPGQSVEPLLVSGGAAPFFGPPGTEGLSCEGSTGSGCKAEVTLTQLSEGAPDGQIVVRTLNLGDGDANGGEVPVRIEDVLPAGLKAVAVEGLANGAAGTEFGSIHSDGPVTCGAVTETPLVCTFGDVLRPYEPIELRISVVAEPGASLGEENRVTVSGGGAVAAKTITRPVQIGGSQHFGVEENVLAPEEAGGGFDTQAGSHPFQVTNTLTFNQGPFTGEGGGGDVFPVGLPKYASELLPAGLIGNPTPVAQCTDQQFIVPVIGQPNNCPLDSVVGVAAITTDEPAHLHLNLSVSPIFNLVPEAGEPARFGFYVDSVVPVFLDASVRTGGDYGVTVSSHDISEIPGLLGTSTTFWGVPGDPRHDGQRGSLCLLHDVSCPSGESSPPPFLSMPASCDGSLSAQAQADSWEDPAEVVTAGLSEPLPGMDGCNHLSFSPSVMVAPDVSDASTPTGLEVAIHVPQTGALNAEGLAQGDVRDTTVVLPAGVSLNAGGADGVEACGEAQIGFLGKDTIDPALNLFTPVLGEPFCPDAAKIGTVEIQTPLLPNKLEGAVYLASPAPAGEGGMNPFNGLLALYIVARDKVSGTLVKLAGRVVPDPVTGQLTSTFEDTPQLPFENLRLRFFGGSRAPLATPGLCGSYTTSASFMPWSLEEGAQPTRSSSSFAITSGPNGGPCADPRPFRPEFHASSSNIQAGAFTPLVTSIGHPDADQVLGGLSLRFPPGLSGTLAAVKLCGEPQAAQGTCGPESLIGHTTVTAGLGSTPAVVKRPGDVYITGPYKGAPFGLIIATPAETGPFDLGRGTPCDCVVVRAKLEIDPHTRGSVITDPLRRSSKASR